LYSDGAVKISNSIRVYPSPIDHDIFGKEKKCSERVLFPQIILPIPGASTENKRLPVQRDEKLRLSIQANGQTILKDELSYGMISSEFYKSYRKHKTGKSDLGADHRVAFKRANGGLIVLNVAPFFLEGYPRGVRSAIYSLFLSRFPQSPDRFICKTVSITMHLNEIVRALRNSIEDSGS
jgi:hypothetical protein